MKPKARASPTRLFIWTQDLTWIYATSDRPGFWHSSTIDRWSLALKQWDPQNALPYLIAAQKIGVTDHP